MRTDEVSRQVVEIFTQRCGLEQDSIHPTSHLFEDLCLDSIDAVEISIALEKTFGVEFGEEGLKGVSTVSDLINRIVELLKSKKIST